MKDIAEAGRARSIEKPSQRVRGIAESVILSERLAIAKALRLPQPIRKKIFSYWVSEEKLLKRVDDIKIYQINPTHSNKNIADRYVAPKGVKQLVNQ